MEYYWAGSLLPAAEMASGIASGVADIGMILPPYNPSEFPIANWATALGALVDTPYPYSTLQGAAANAEALLANKDVLAEFERQGLVILTPLFAYPNYDLLCAMPVTTLEEAKGKRVRVGGNLWAGQAQAVGMEPVALPGSDVYQAAQRGVVDCVMQYPAGFVGNSVWDVIKDYTPVQFTGWNAMYLVMGRDKWLSLTESQQKAVLDSAVTYFVLTHKKSLKDYAVFAGPEADTHGVVFHTPDPAFFDAIKAAQAASLSNAVANAPDTLADAAGFEDQYRQAMAKWGEIVMKDAPGAGAANDAAIDTRAALLSGAELDLTNWGEQVRHEVFDNYRP